MTSPLDPAAQSRPQPPSGTATRRALLAGAAGLVIGSAATLGGQALATNNSTPPRPPTPGEELMTEHGILKRLLLAYRAASTQLAAGQTPPAGAILDAAQIMSDYIEGFHEGLEEAYVFPRVARDGQHAALVTTLLTQHDRGRHLTAAITTVTGGDLSAATIRTTLRSYLDQFVAMYEPHEAWEDTVVYPALRAITLQRTLDDLASRFADLENTQYGDNALSLVLQRVTGIEQQLDISNLNSFTPPEIEATS